jgi:hypothetical protein
LHGENPNGSITTGYITPAVALPRGYVAQLTLPHGAAVERLYGVVADDDPDGYVSLEFYGYEAGLSGPPTRTKLAGGDTATGGTPGITSIELLLDPPVVVREWTDIDGDGLSDVASYVLTVGCYNPSDVNLLRFWGVLVTWSRTVSPAPSTATFGDVPTGHAFFQFVEALANAGITGGCGGGNYCPNSPLTRGQMAVFLSTALGLHWPN